MKRVVMGLSGGMDSVTLLGLLLDKGAEEVLCINFLYGSKHNKYENLAFMEIMNFYTAKYDNKVLKYESINLSNIFTNISSNLLLDGGEIPEGHYAEESMKKTVVPGRNLIFSSILAGIAESVNADTIALGVHAGDHHIYPDCRKEFIENLDKTIKVSTENKVSVYAPFLQMDKTDILKIGFAQNPEVPYNLTRTCYKNQFFSCGKCGSCVERLEAFNNLGIKDPIKYEET